eukprot:Amastigsp_a676645_163.p2 type:complete len:124 gc:universal Amastigsp_a676645_163:969-598(-)
MPCWWPDNVPTHSPLSAPMTRRSQSLMSPSSEPVSTRLGVSSTKVTALTSSLCARRHDARRPRSRSKMCSELSELPPRRLDPSGENASEKKQMRSPAWAVITHCSWRACHWSTSLAPSGRRTR